MRQAYRTRARRRFVRTAKMRPETACSILSSPIFAVVLTWLIALATTAAPAQSIPDAGIGGDYVRKATDHSIANSVSSTSLDTPRDDPFCSIAPKRLRRMRAKAGKRAAIYARFSCRFQHSIEDQVRVCRQWIETNGMELADEHIYYDKAVTGKSSKRIGFLRLKDALERDQFDVVVVFVTSRLFRKTYRTLQFVEEEIVDRRKRCVFVKSGIDTNDKEHFGKLLHIHGLVDELTISMQVAHIRAAHEGQLRIGVVFGTLTYGFRGEEIDGQTNRRGKPARRLAIDPKTSEWVKTIFHWFADLEESIEEIVRKLNSIGVSEAPPPERARTKRWTYTIVRRILDNRRYVGDWAYGDKEAVWKNKANYSRQYKREKPLAQVQFDHLRIIDERTWNLAQGRLLGCRRQGGRRPKDGDRMSRPTVLHGLCYCQEHDRIMYVGGSFGKYLFCPECRASGKPAIYTQLPRRFASIKLCTLIAELIKSDPSLMKEVLETCAAYADDLQKPDPGELERLRQRSTKLSSDIEFIRQAPAITAEDQAEDHQRLLELRQERANLATVIKNLESIVTAKHELPSQAELESLQKELSKVLIEATDSDDQEKIAAARRILRAVTGGRILISQQGETKKRRGWLRGTFTLRLITPVMEHFNLPVPEGASRTVVVDFRKPSPAEQLADAVKTLWDQGLLVKAIAAELSTQLKKKIGRSMVKKALVHWFTSRGEQVPDGRSRRSELEIKHLEPPLYQRVADEVMELMNTGMLYNEIAERLNLDFTTLTAAVRYWHESRGLQPPDGRTRRRSLDRKCR